MENTKQLVLKKHVNAIHCSNTISLVQRKIANALLYNAYDDLIKKDKYQISVSSLCKLIGFNSNDHKAIKEALTGLMSTVIQWNVIEESVNKPTERAEWKASTMLADATISGSMCTYSYSGNLKELFYMPSVYGRLDMSVLARFKSSYGIALYENCIRYQDVHQTPWLDVATFRKLMGVEQGEYLIFRDLKRRVIDKAVEEVNKLSMLKIIPNFRRQNRKVTEIKFFIEKQGREQEKIQLNNSKIPAARNGLWQKLKAQYTLADEGIWYKLKDEFALSEEEIEIIFTNYSVDYIFEKIELVEDSKSYNKGEIRNLSHYLLSALEKDYKAPVSSKKVLLKKQKKQESIIKSAEDEQVTLLKNYDRYVTDIIDSTLIQLNEIDRDMLEQDFSNYLSCHKIHKNKYKLLQEKGLQHISIKFTYHKFIRDFKPHLIPSVMSFDEYKDLNKSTI